MLARPFEASEAWLATAALAAAGSDDAVEATGRAIALETEADPDRSPLMPFAQARAALALTGSDALDLLEDKLRLGKTCEPAPFDRAEWVQRRRAPPHSVWRLYEGSVDGGKPVRLLASLMIFGRQTDQRARSRASGVHRGRRRGAADRRRAGGQYVHHGARPGALPVATPTSWLLNCAGSGRGRRRCRRSRPAAGAAARRHRHRPRRATGGRWPTDSPRLWPDTALPELLGKTPRAGDRRAAWPALAWRR